MRRHKPQPQASTPNHKAVFFEEFKRNSRNEQSQKAKYHDMGLFWPNKECHPIRRTLCCTAPGGLGADVPVLEFNGGDDGFD